MSPSLPEKILQQIQKAGLPTGGRHPFRPQLARNRSGDPVIEKKPVRMGPKRGKRGYVDDQGRIWVKDHAHAGVPEHWDVQIDDGADYIRVDLSGNELP